jgi:hypothetical protein
MSSVTEMRILRDRPRLPVADGVTVHLLVVSVTGAYCAGVDLATGALVRAWAEAAPEERVRPLDVVEVVTDLEADLVPDPFQPEAFGVAGAPVVVDRLPARRAERLIRPLLHPERGHLLGVSATAIPFWERSGDHPSIAVVEPKGRVVLVRQGGYLGCRFGWLGHERELPCLDRALAGHMDRSGRTRLVAGKGDRLVVALSAPIEGRCHKVVETLLHRF